MTMFRAVPAFLAVALLAQTNPSRFSADLPRRPEISAAFAWIDAHRAEHLAEWIRITEIPAPSKNEQRRASYIRVEMERAGLSDVYVDEAGNVVGTRKGSITGPAVVFTAHTDTVFPSGTDVAVRRDGQTLRAPGVYDNSASIANMLAAIRALNAGRVQTRADLIFIATAQEETGLHGMRYWLEHNRDHAGMIVAMDSVSLHTVSYGALGIRWLKFIYTSEGSDTNRSRGKPNPAKAIARAIHDIYTIQLPEPTPESTVVYNVSMIGGGQMVNAISQESFFTIDVRANDRMVFEDILKRANRFAEDAAKAEETGFRKETLLDLPAGGNLKQLEPRRAHPLVQTAVDVQTFLDMGRGRSVVAVPSGSSDANIGVEMGIPSIGIGNTFGSGQHTLQEQAEIDADWRGAKQIVLLAASLGDQRR